MKILETKEEEVGKHLQKTRKLEYLQIVLFSKYY
jgi:hypothetical protein